MTRSSFAIAYTIYYVYVYINVYSRGIRAPHGSRLLPPRPFLASYDIGFLRHEIWDYIFSTINHSGKGKSKAESRKRMERDEYANVNVARNAQSQLALFFSPLGNSIT